MSSPFRNERRGRQACNFEVWRGFLDRQVRPMDVDMFVSSSIYSLAAEMTTVGSTWKEKCDVAKGQVLAYQALTLGSCRTISALCKHSTPVDCDIDTRNGVEDYEVMFPGQFGHLKFCQPLHEWGMAWQEFVRCFVSNPQALLLRLRNGI
jgi:hypothetical protein